VILSIAIKIILIPYNMVNGEAVARVWNALWWAEKPFFVFPNVTHPLFFYFMGPLIYLTGEIYYTPLISMILVVTIGGIYLFRISLVLFDFKTALITFVLFTFSPAVFRLNYNPYPYTITPVFYVITVYYFLRAIFLNESRKNFIIAGVFSFLALFNRPESLFVIMCLCVIAFFTKKKGYVSFIILSLWFQVFWILLSLFVHGTPFATFDKASEYPNLFDIQGLNLPLRLKGLFLPYYFWILGVTIIVFYFLIKGIFILRKNYPPVILITLFVPILVPALANGVAAMQATIFNGTFYLYSMFFFSCIFAAAGIGELINRYNSGTVRGLIISAILISTIPLAYIKDLVPGSLNKLFPKSIQFIETAPQPAEIRKMCDVVDSYINDYPSLVLDCEGDTETTTMYIAYRTRSAPPGKIILTGYDLRREIEGYELRLSDFMSNNRRGILISKNSSTMLSEILQNTAGTGLRNFKLNRVANTEHWSAFLFELVQ